MSRNASALAGVEQARSASAPWRRAAPAVALALLALLVIFWPTTVFTVGFWETDSAYSHGYLVVPISLFLVWQRRAELASLTPGVQMWGLPLLLGLGILWALAYLAGVQLAMQLALLALIGVMLWTLLGTEVSRRLVFPVGYLLVAIPVWSLLTTTLQEYTAIASTRALRSLGVPVYLEAFYISIPAGRFVVEEICAGLRYFLATASIAALFAYLNYRRVVLGALFVVVAVALSIIMNWVRVIVIILAGHLYSMETFLVKDHIAFGWVLFVVVLVPIFSIGVWLQRFDRKADDHGPASATPAASTPKSGRKLFATMAMALAAAAIAPAAVLWAAAAPPATADIRLQLPAAEAPWTITGAPDTGWRPKFLGADARVLASYAENGARVSLYIAYYAYQRDGAELINELNRPYDKERWQPRRENDRRVTLADGTAIDVREIELVAGNGQERLVWYWYRMGDARTASAAVAKLWQLANSVTGSPEGTAIAVSAPSQGSLDAVRSDLEQFLGVMAAPIAASIEGAGRP